jgi:hypothetical protein
MSDDNRDDHLNWAKARALEYVDPGNVMQAMASLTSDLTKHDETHKLVTRDLLVVTTRIAMRGDVEAARAFIDDLA